MKKLNITFCSFPDFSGNAKALYNYISKNYNNFFEITWIQTEITKPFPKKNIEYIKIGTKEYDKYMKTTDIIFSTHANITGSKNKKSIYVELWHGIGMKPVGYLANNMTNKEKEWYGSIRNSIDYFIVPSEFWRVVFSCLFQFNPQRILPIGYPKLDLINNKNSLQLLEKIYPDASKYNKIILYLPTFKKGCGRIELEENSQLFDINDYSEKELLDYLIEKNILLIVKSHPSEERKTKIIDTPNILYLKEKDLYENCIDISELINSADVLITDYSSVGIEFLFTGKKTIFINNNYNKYCETRGIIFNNITFWNDNDSITNMKELFEHIENSNKFISNKTKKELFFGQLKNGGCSNIYDYFFEDGKLKKDIKQNVTKENKLERRIEELEKEKKIDYENHRIAIERYEKEKQYDYMVHEKEIKKLNQELDRIHNMLFWKIEKRLVKIKEIIRGRNK